MSAQIEKTKLNLTRKWRAQNFDHIVGQTVCVKMLKNSLYLDQFFPVYLFAGQRGCGKTSTARVFAAAVNCQQLDTFQKNPKSVSVPCLTCDSCRALYAGKHPDFVEIDAASHTGVDNVRSIIDASSLLPVMGRKKIYLIDEAHMLSKAAFNAFLKILEEPPSTVLYILATTDPEKILDTVRSRCFKLIFNPIEHNTLLSHLVSICKNESIKADVAGLELIIKETQGSARDAINLLEQARFSYGAISAQSVSQLLGYLDSNTIIKLSSILLYGNAKQLIACLSDIGFSSYSPQFVWRQIVDFLRVLTWASYGVAPGHYDDKKEVMYTILKNCSPARVAHILGQFCEHELMFQKTTNKHAFLEALLIELLQEDDTSMGTPPAVTAAPVTADDSELIDADDEDEDIDQDDQEEEEIEDEDAQKKWDRFVSHIEDLNEPLLASIFKHGKVESVTDDSKQMHVAFSKDFVFFNDWLTESKAIWMPFFERYFSKCTLVPAFTLERSKEQQTNTRMYVRLKKKTAIQEQPAKEEPQNVRSDHKTSGQLWQKQRPIRQTQTRIKTRSVTISDKELYKRTHLLLHYFPGTVQEVLSDVS